MIQTEFLGIQVEMLRYESRQLSWEDFTMLIAFMINFLRELLTMSAVGGPCRRCMVPGVLLLLIAVGTPHPLCGGELVFTIEESARVPVSSKVHANVWATQVWTHKKDLYLVWVTPQQELVIAQFRNGTENERTVLLKDVAEDNHNTGSMGIDRKGYIHVAGNLHNGAPGKFTWNYWISQKPYSIKAFDFRGGKMFGPVEYRTRIPGAFPTYPHFHRGPKNALYVSYRGRVLGGDLRPGYMGMQLAKQKQAGTDQWDSLGAQAPDPDPWPVNTLGWIANGKWDHLYYQTYRMPLAHDGKKTIHAAWTVYGPESRNQAVHENVGSGATHVIHAMTRDGGKIWRSADGSELKLPVGIDQPAAVVHESNPGDLTSTVTIAVTHDSRPVITYRRGGMPMLGTPTLRVADANGIWSEERPMPNGNMMVFVLPDGTFLSPGTGGGWNSSMDEGKTWERHEVGAPVDYGENATADHYLFQDEGIIRIAAVETDEKDTRELVVRTLTVTREK